MGDLLLSNVVEKLLAALNAEDIVKPMRFRHVSCHFHDSLPAFLKRAILITVLENRRHRACGALYSEGVFTLSLAGAGRRDQAEPLTDRLDAIRKPKYRERVREQASVTAVRRTRRRARDIGVPF